jgi:predicted nucleic acid-binding protein
MVLDPSVALSWYFRDEESDQSLAIHAMTDTWQLVVPPHWFAEVANGIRQGERRGRCDPADLPRFLDLLGQLDYAVDTLKPFSQFDLILPFAREYDLTVYDAAYLHCAASNRLPLAAFDKPLSRAAKRAGVPVIDGRQ